MTTQLSKVIPMKLRAAISIQIVVFLSSHLLLSQTAPTPPVCAKIPRYDTLHHDVRLDEYFWLRERSNPEVLKHLEAENAYTAEVMKPTEAMQEVLYKEMVGRIKETDQDPPYPDGSFLYYSRTEKGKQYPIFCRTKNAPEAPEEVLFDQNQHAGGHSFYRVAELEVSPDHRLLAFAVDTNGSESYTLHVKELATGSILPDRVPDIESIVWATDSRTILYTVEDSAKRPFRVFRHTLGTPTSADPLLFEEKDELYTVGLELSRSKAFIFLNSSASNSDEWQYLRADSPGDKFRVIIPRVPGHEYTVYDHGTDLYIRTNKNAKTFRLVRAPISDPAEPNWIEVLPYREKVTLEGADFFAGHYVAYERERGMQQMRVTNFRDASVHYIEFADPVYTAFGNINRLNETSTFRFSYQSMTMPASIYDYDVVNRTRMLVKQQEVVGGYDPAQYASERLFAKASDGTDIPISLVYKKGLKKEGPSPLHMTGYGSYGSSSQPSFSSARLSYLDRGVVFAIAHVRGGGDMGREWYDDGKLLKKKNTFSDFIACAEHLIAKGYTTPEQLTISGGSAGGLLMGAVVNMRPDLFKAVVASVPFVDVINTMLDPGLMFTAQEYLEWGNPNDFEYYEYMKSYCPYINVSAQRYPNMLVKVGLHDPRVNYWEGTKWVARLRERKTDSNTILLKVNMGAGHAGASGRYERLKEVAFDYAYILSQYGIQLSLHDSR